MVDRPKTPIGTLETYIDGSFKKYSNNDGYVIFTYVCAGVLISLINLHAHAQALQAHTFKLEPSLYALTFCIHLCKCASVSACKQTKIILHPCCIAVSYVRAQPLVCVPLLISLPERHAGVATRHSLSLTLRTKRVAKSSLLWTFRVSETSTQILRFTLRYCCVLFVCERLCVCSLHDLLLCLASSCVSVSQCVSA